MNMAYIETRLVEKFSFPGECFRNFCKTFFGGKMIIAYIETRLVEKSSCPREKREFCVDVVLVVLAKFSHIGGGETLPKFLEHIFWKKDDHSIC